MTTISMRERWTFAGLDLSTYAVIVSGVAGADELPPVRGENFPRTGLDGRLYLPKKLDSRRMSLMLLVTATDASGANPSATQARTNLDALLAVLGPRAQGTLSRVMPDASTRSALAECIGVNSFTDPANKEVFTLVAEFDLADPFWYGSSTTGPGATSIASSPTDFTFTPGGSLTTERLLIDITGQLVHPRLTNLTTGAYVDVNATVASTKHLLIDTQAFTVTNDGTDVIGLLTHGQHVGWLSLLPTANSLRVTGTSPSGASITVTAYPAWA